MRLSATCLAATLAVACAFPAFAGARLQPELATLVHVPAVELATATVQKGIAAAAQRKSLPLQFAVDVPLNLGLADGLWDEADAATARWRLQLRSPNAYSLHVHFSRFRVPAGAELWFYDTDGRLVQGPFTHASEQADGRLATPVVMGNAAALELRVPKALRDQVQLSVSNAFHGYTDLRKVEGNQAKAGACERDVVCPEGAAWNNEIRSGARLQTGQYLCSAQLLNNARLDETPFLVTASHCGVDATNASSIVAYFNFQKPECGGGNGTLEQFVSGAIFRRNDPGSDFSLMVLSTKPSPSFNVYYSGWDASGEDVNSGAGIHHPQGDEKSISLFDNPARKIEDACSAQNESGDCIMVVDSWEVGWSSGVVGSPGTELEFAL